MTHLTLVCDLETCTTCREAVLTVNAKGECRPCASFAHNLRLMAVGVTRGKDGRYMKIGAKK